MSDAASDPSPDPTAAGYAAPSTARVALLVALLLLTGAAAGAATLWWTGGWGLTGAAAAGPRANAVWTGLATATATGGLLALLLRWRGQRTAEAVLDHRERDLAQRRAAEAHQTAERRRAAAAAHADSVERRLSAAVDQLGGDRDPIRLGGLNTLERLATAHPDRRQDVVDVLCACLRAPFDTGEFAVRAAVQRVLTRHLRPGDDPAAPAPDFWPDLDLDLTGAHLIDLDLTGCRVRAITCDNAVFEGRAVLRRTRVGGRARFRAARFLDGISARGARFHAAADFRDAEFDAPEDWPDAGFRAAEFHGDATFARAAFTAEAQFRETRFQSDVSFDRAVFAGGAAFTCAEFRGSAWFGGAVLTGPVDLGGTRFHRHARFCDTTFDGPAVFTGAHFDGFTDFESVDFRDTATFTEAEFAADPPPELTDYLT
ncbi:pentapeptide repeat-containing protein [Actinokineospora bangkokensis]|uniref:Pentapeptide repeat-containing protein n=1 Tax=Actinokineospora bangkokensis TaxID=1193682 RepID=A0A1Q9LJ53_9PSEU|nr:pentapeptide repeat-containing protein [Actinokineospora bangkokensis]OLR92009.1 hypothetical protein BJP25_24685 [Actinokineospora bangkokensis]